MLLSQLRPLLMILYLVLAGTGTVVAITLYLHIPFSALMALICVCVIFSIYTLNRFTDMREDFANDSSRAIYFHKRKKTLYRIVWIAFAIAIAALVFTENMSVYFMVLFGIGLLYSCRVIPWYDYKNHRSYYTRLKDIPLMKNILVALLWGLSPFMVIGLLGHPGTSSIFYLGMLSASLIISTFDNTLFYDVLDKPGDKLMGQWTLPSVMGEKFTFFVLLTVNAIWIAVIASLALLQMVDIKHTIFLLGLAIYPIVYLLPYWRRWLKRKSLEFLCETDLVAFSAGLIVLSLL